LTNPDNGCVPYNLFGLPQSDRPVAVPSVNSQAALDYIVGGGDPYVLRRLTRNTVSFDIGGEPFSTWAGPVSMAVGAEWREDEVSSRPDALSAERKHYSTNFGTPYDSSNDVTEGFVEALVPLVSAKPWADSIDLNTAVRVTDYSTSGSVVTWKAGLTYDIPGGLRLRATQSRDIRAPNLTELFSSPTTGRTAFSDPFLGNASFPVWQVSVGNPQLEPEEANTTGFGVVYQPSWLSGFSAAVDYFQIDLKGAIASPTPQDILDLCYAGDASYCSFITRFADGTIDSIVLQPINQDSQVVRGVDIETSYRLPLSAMVSAWNGDLVLRALATRTLENETDTGLVVVDRAGDNGASVPRWSVTTNIGYTLGSFRATWTGRYISAGNVSNTYIECLTDCPAVIPRGYTTVDNNRVASNFTHGIALSYGLYKGGLGDMDVSFTVHNIANKVPPLIAQSGNAYGPHTNANLYDIIGREFLLGVRWKM
jgi:outer membrane receptor protein involved in Fe transport